MPAYGLLSVGLVARSVLSNLVGVATVLSTCVIYSNSLSLSLSLSLSISLSPYLSVYLSVFISIYLCMHIYIYMYISVSPSVCLSLSLSLDPDCDFDNWSDCPEGSAPQSTKGGAALGHLVK